MSESHLPDDVAQWPNDPYLLLGVDHSVDRQTLRRAYVRLIRVYRPEHFPDQFRRVREAYEHLEAYWRYRQQFAGDASTSTADEPENAGAENHLDAGCASDNKTMSAPASRLGEPAESPVDVAWKLARKGQPGEAYRHLRELEQRQPGNEELCLRLYWLLVLYPNLDPSCDRRAWLVAGLPAAGLAGRLLELYGRELEGDPSESRHPRCRSLLQQPAPLGQRAAFAMRCWAYLGLTNCWNLIAEDLEHFREQFATSHVNIWVRMLLACKEQLHWQDDWGACSALAHVCHREIEQHSEEHHELSWELDRNEYVDMLTDELQALTQSECLPSETARQLGKLLRRSWVLPVGMIREDLLTFLRPMVEEPIRGLNTLDHVYQTSVIVLHQLNLQVQALYHQRHDSRNDTGRSAEHQEAVSAFFDEREPSVYEDWRLSIFLFCLRHGMTFGQFQQAATVIPLSSNLTERWKQELPLHCLTTACEAFWAEDQEGPGVIELRSDAARSF
jgi:hypothetical protein